MTRYPLRVYNEAMNRRHYKNELLQQQVRRLRPNVAALCRELEISRTTYYDILKGNGVTPDLLARFCAHLELRYADVIRLEPLPVS